MTVSHAGPAVEAADLEAAIAVMRGRGLRVSAARRLVLEALYMAGEPVSAERIADGLGGELPQSDLASVYRNLETLEQLGLVRHVHLGHGAGRYVRAGDAREYVVCDSCGCFEAVEEGGLEDVRALIEGRFGYEARFSHFPIVGLCGECRAGDA